jgi:hypothetical protein
VATGILVALAILAGFAFAQLTAFYGVHVGTVALVANVVCLFVVDYVVKLRKGKWTPKS